MCHPLVLGVPLSATLFSGMLHIIVDLPIPTFE